MGVYRIWEIHGRGRKTALDGCRSKEVKRSALLQTTTASFETGKEPAQDSRPHPPFKRRLKPMSIIRKTVFCTSLAGLLVLGVSANARSAGQQQGGKQGGESKQQAVKSVSGKISTIGSGGSSFSLEVVGNNSKKMDFVVDKNTQVKGQVREGTAVTVEYQAMNNGQFLAVSITAQG
jgi:hypothetical protein